MEVFHVEHLQFYFVKTELGHKQYNHLATSLLHYMRSQTLGVHEQLGQEREKMGQ
jgi:hypothetical protein